MLSTVSICLFMFILLCGFLLLEFYSVCFALFFWEIAGFSSTHATFFPSKILVNQSYSSLLAHPLSKFFSSPLPIVASPHASGHSVAATAAAPSASSSQSQHSHAIPLPASPVPRAPAPEKKSKTDRVPVFASSLSIAHSPPSASASAHATASSASSRARSHSFPPRSSRRQPDENRDHRHSSCSPLFSSSLASASSIRSVAASVLPREVLHHIDEVGCAVRDNQ